MLLSILLFSTLLSLLKLNLTHFSFILFAHISLLKLSDAADSFVCLSCPSKWPHLFSIATPCPLPISLSFSLFLPFMLSNNGKEIRSVCFCCVCLLHSLCFYSTKIRQSVCKFVYICEDVCVSVWAYFVAHLCAWPEVVRSADTLHPQATTAKGNSPSPRLPFHLFVFSLSSLHNGAHNIYHLTESQAQSVSRKNNYEDIHGS